MFFPEQSMLVTIVINVAQISSWLDLNESY
jgi:hypothetical protein